jgi:hypothetical protein
MIITNIFTQTLFFTFYIIAFPSEFRNSNKRDTIDNSPDISSTTLVDDILNTTDLPVQETSVVPAVDQIISEVVQETSIVEVPAVEQTIPDTVFTTILVSANGTPVPFYSSDNIEPTETPVVVLEEPIPVETLYETPVVVLEEPIPAETLYETPVVVLEDPIPVETPYETPVVVLEEPIPAETPCETPAVVLEEPIPVETPYETPVVVLEEPIPAETPCETLYETPVVVLEEPIPAETPCETLYETPAVVLEEPIPAETPCETLVPNSTTKILIIPTETCEIVTIVMTTFLTTVLTTAEISSPTNLPICIQPTNFCDSTDSSIIPSNGTQNIISSCSSTVQGVIPSVEHLVSTLILEPVNGDILVSGQNVTIIIKTLNMNFGFFDNPNTEYYAEPQTLDVNGSINGHSHITIEKILDDNSFPDPKAPIFFKGLEQSINFEGNLSVDIDSSILSESGAGTYRICTITSSSSHQPVLMPIARRGATDDCIRVIVI